jgi:hypothetical protein
MLGCTAASGTLGDDGCGSCLGTIAHCMCFLDPYKGMQIYRGRCFLTRGRWFRGYGYEIRSLQLRLRSILAATAHCVLPGLDGCFVSISVMVLLFEDETPAESFGI